MTVTDSTDLRSAMITAAERQLAASAGNDISTRAVCDAAGVTQPVLYRLFGDKEGLLDAVAEHGFERYAASKAAQPRTTDPVADLLAGWDNHMDFARRNPALYQLMFAPRPRSNSAARRRVFELLEDGLVRCAAVGALTVEPKVAAQLILSANVGVALNLIAQPDLFDAKLSHRMRDAVFGTVLTESGPPVRTDPVGAAAVRLRAQLSLTGTATLEPAETALLDRWLERIAGATAPEEH
ncbi:TetR/AcrR family transcriptional regulator [Amycolatopsis pigmentata]|uniref:TetR/AcrR family transcriptional regulator n=1 Tax=Amycolatopsis pigmentata TaxID=450801 RepID=A0ABW5G658_9PSEU